MYNGYNAIAGVYDRLNAEIDYHTWGDFIDTCFERYLPHSPKIILDLACGTGRMTFEMASRGYDLIGIDGSADMLSEAYAKSTEIYCFDDTDVPHFAVSGDGVTPPLFLQQDMRSFELYGTVDAALCCLDSINYLTDETDLISCLDCLQLYIAPGGLLIFDVNTPYKFENIYGQNAYILEDEKAFCAWQNEYDPITKKCSFFLSLFEEQKDGRYIRSDEEQVERCYSRNELLSALDSSGFDLCGIFGGYDFNEPSDTCERWYIVARTRKTGDWYLCEDR